jgi:hypothetical protein
MSPTRKRVTQPGSAAPPSSRRFRHHVVLDVVANLFLTPECRSRTASGIGTDSGITRC